MPIKGSLYKEYKVGVMKFDVKKIQELLALMKKNKAAHLYWKTKEDEIELSLEEEVSHPNIPVSHNTPVSSVSHDVNLPVNEGRYITSPLVGIFYQRPSPSSDKYVTLHQKINEDTVVCIIEAMKVMNEIKSGLSGKIVEVLVEDGESVEFGTRLFRVE